MEILDLITYSPPFQGTVQYAEVVTLAVAGAIAAASAISQGITRAVQAKRQRKALRKERQRLDQRMQDLGAFYNEDLNKDYLDTEVASSAVSKLSDAYKKGMNQLDQTAVKRGLTDEARVATADNMNQNLAEGMSSIAAQGTAYKQNLKEQYQRGKQQIDASEDALTQARNAADNEKYNAIADNIGNAAGAISTAYAGMKGAATTASSDSAFKEVDLGAAKTAFNNKTDQYTKLVSYGKQ